MLLNHSRHYHEVIDVQVVDAHVETSYDGFESTGGKDIGCPYCDEEFYSQAQLHLHLEKDHFIVGKMCLTCDRTYTSLNGLNQHIRSVHGKNLPGVNNDYPIRGPDPRQRRASDRHQGPQSAENRRHTIADTGDRTSKSYSVFDYKSMLKDHHFKCRFCDLQCSSLDEITTHLSKNHEADDHWCFECQHDLYNNLKFQSKNTRYYLNKHLKEFHGADTTDLLQACPVCQVDYVLAELEDHISDTHQIQGLNCLRCAKKFPKKHMIYNHVRSVHEGPNAVTTDEGTLIKARIERDGSETHKVCALCQKEFKDDQSMVLHLLKEHFKNPFETKEIMNSLESDCINCVLCYYSTKTVESFMRHCAKRHDNVISPAINEDLIMRFKGKIGLDEIENFYYMLCNYGSLKIGQAVVDCEVPDWIERIVKSADDKKSSTSTTEPKLYNPVARCNPHCTMCSQTFPKFRHLTDHLKRKHSYDPYQINECIKGLDLSRITCGKCGSSCKTEESFRNHSSRIHNNIVSLKQNAAIILKSKDNSVKSQSSVKSIESVKTNLRLSRQSLPSKLSEIVTGSSRLSLPGISKPLSDQRICCDICPDYKANVNNFTIHMKSNHLKNPYETYQQLKSNGFDRILCAICQSNYSDFPLFEKHCIEKHGGSISLEQNQQEIFKYRENEKGCGDMLIDETEDIGVLDGFEKHCIEKHGGSISLEQNQQEIFKYRENEKGCGDMLIDETEDIGVLDGSYNSCHQCPKVFKNDTKLAQHLGIEHALSLYETTEYLRKIGIHKIMCCLCFFCCKSAASFSQHFKSQHGRAMEAAENEEIAYSSKGKELHINDDYLDLEHVVDVDKTLCGHHYLYANDVADVDVENRGNSSWIVNGSDIFPTGPKRDPFVDIGVVIGQDAVQDAVKSGSSARSSMWNVGIPIKRQDIDLSTQIDVSIVFLN
jgi:hypothetical protein